MVMGLGRFGGGLGVTRWLLDHGARVIVTDTDDEKTLQDALAPLAPDIAAGRLQLRLGGHVEDDFREADLVVVNPAVPHPWDNPYLDVARANGTPLTTEIRLVTERLDRTRVVGITGSAGKSTTTAMINHILSECGHRTHLGGNLGGSLLTTLSDVRQGDFVVLELSSAMLHWLDAGAGQPDDAGWSPHVAVLTNLTPNHLDWHQTIEHYEQSKRNIFRFQVDDDHQVTEEDIHIRRPLALQLPGEHNQTNGLMAMLAALRLANVMPGEAAAALSTFAGLPHRMQLVAEHDGRRFFNDSKSTTPEATLLAVESFKRPSTVHLIAGGYDKGIDLAPIAHLRPRLAGLYTIGATGAWLAREAAAHSVPGSVGSGMVTASETLENAIDAAISRMSSGDVLVLSPGCASWDQFDHYEDRGERFSMLVEASLSQSDPARRRTSMKSR